MILSAQRSRRWSSSFRWVVADSSLRRPGFQCLHLASTIAMIGGREWKDLHLARSIHSCCWWRAVWNAESGAPAIDVKRLKQVS
jgi:hypothetical protein